jgi:hypothetical protein
MTMTSGSGILTHIFDYYGPIKDGKVAHRKNGVLISMIKGKALGYALWNLQERGRMFIRFAQPHLFHDSALMLIFYINHHLFERLMGNTINILDHHFRTSDRRAYREHDFSGQ